LVRCISAAKKNHKNVEGLEVAEQTGGCCTLEVWAQVAGRQRLGWTQESEACFVVGRTNSASSEISSFCNDTSHVVVPDEAFRAVIAN
jgi:hypothetical protein